MPSKESEAVVRHWTTARLTSQLPVAEQPDRVLLCFHGGGFVSGSISSHRKMFGHLAKAVGARALLFDYRLAPEHTHRPDRSAR